MLTLIVLPEYERKLHQQDVRRPGSLGRTWVEVGFWEVLSSWLTIASVKKKHDEATHVCLEWGYLHEKMENTSTICTHGQSTKKVEETK